MSLMPAVVVLSCLSGLLALVLGVTYVRTWRQVRSPFTVGLVLFALFLVVHSAITVWHQATMMATFTAQAQLWLVIEGVLEIVALGALVWATMR